jgi:hypothetical protein
MTMKRTNAAVATLTPKAPAPKVVMTQGPEKRVLTIPELAHYLNMKNWAAEEALRQGKIRFKWMGKRKVVDKKDADAYFDSLPYAEIQIKLQRPETQKLVTFMPRHAFRAEKLRTNGQKSHRKRTRKAKFAGFKKNEAGNYVIYIR